MLLSKIKKITGRKYFVEIVRFDDDKVIWRYGPYSKKKAEEVENSWIGCLNREEFFTRIVK